MLIYRILHHYFLFTTIWNYIKNGHWALLENLFFAFWVASFLFMALLLRSKKKNRKKLKIEADLPVLTSVIIRIYICCSSNKQTFYCCIHTKLVRTTILSVH